jgi:hypothetical protein
LVDAFKAFGGGVSNCGFGHLTTMLDRLFSGANLTAGDKNDRKTLLAYGSVRAVLRANWLNGSLSLADQKAVAKTLIKLRLDASNAAQLAEATGLDATVLTSIATAYGNGAPLTTPQQDAAGRFDLQLSTIIDEGYQRADQSYRNGAKLLAVVFAVALAIGGKLALNDDTVTWGMSLLAGLLSAPLAPISKDLASALQAGAQTLQFFRK